MVFCLHVFVKFAQHTFKKIIKTSFCLTGPPANISVFVKKLIDSMHELNLKTTKENICTYANENYRTKVIKLFKKGDF